MHETIAHNNTNELVKELGPRNQWVCHRNKVPLNPRTGNAAISTDSTTWGTYEEAVAFATANAGIGVGFVLSVADPYTCIDLDDPTNLKKGFTPQQIQEIHALHQRIYSAFDTTYSERSPSGKGLHIWCKGSVPSARKRTDKCVEVYSTARFFTVTGWAHNNVPIAEANGNLRKLWEEMGGKDAVPTVAWNQPQTRSDDWVIQQCQQISTAPLFQTLWAGDISQHNNDGSSADLALMNLIAFHTDNKEQCIRIFRKSVLGQRIKDGKVKSNRDDYMKWTVEKAFDQKLPMVCDPATLIVPKGNVPIQNVPFFSPVQVPQKRRVEVISVADIQPEKIIWLWHDHLPLGKLSLIAGGPGIGKSTLTLNFAATASNGGMWPDGTQAKQGRVLIWSGEDGVEDTIVPRLLAAGARLDHIHVISATTDNNGNKLPFNPAKDIPLLIETIESMGDVVLVIIDPIVSVVEKDMNQTNVVRNSLQSLVDMANKLGFCVLGITHFKKDSEGQEPLERVMGSLAFVALARTVLVAGKDKFSERRVFAIAKNNVGKDTGGFEYTVESAVVHNDIPTSKVAWGATLSGSAKDILATVESVEKIEQPSSKIEEAKRFLETYLSNGVEVPAIELVNKAGVFGITSKTLQRAKADLGIVDFKKEFGGPSVWRFPLKFDNNTNALTQGGT